MAGYITERNSTCLTWLKSIPSNRNKTKQKTHAWFNIHKESSIYSELCVNKTYVLCANKVKISEGEKLAETLTICEHGGEVRVGDELVIEEAKFDGKKIKKIVQGKELTIVIASLSPENASLNKLRKNKSGQLIKPVKDILLKLLLIQQ